MMQVLTANDFNDKLGQKFTLIIQPETELGVTLSKITSLPVRNFPGKTRDPFSLIFEGTQGTLCPQGNYLLKHESGWEELLFIVPVGGKPDGNYIYQAIFN